MDALESGPQHCMDAGWKLTRDNGTQRCLGRLAGFIAGALKKIRARIRLSPIWTSTGGSQRHCTIEPGKRSGQPCIRGLPINVWDVLSWVAQDIRAGIFDDYPELE